MDGQQLEDEQLATLAQAFDNRPLTELQAALRAANGDVMTAATRLLDSVSSPGNGESLTAIDTAPSTKRVRSTTVQATLGRYVMDDAARKRLRRVAAIPSSVDAGRLPENGSIVEGDTDQTCDAVATTTSALDRLGWTKESDAATKAAARRPARTVELFRPEDIARHTDCELILDALPTELADALLAEMLESATSWTRSRRWLFDREIVSPHTSAFFVHPHGSWHQFTEQQQQQERTGEEDVAADNEPSSTTPSTEPTSAPSLGDGGESTDHAEKQARDWEQSWYYYSGRRSRKTRIFTSLLQQSAELITQHVHARIAQRTRHRYESREPWFPTVAAANCYASAKESVDWHSDTLTYLGPMPTVASLSLGAARSFRLRRYNIAAASKAETPTIYAVYLPHNSLLLMHPPTQEHWRHQVPAGPVHPHPVAGTTRINLTFRHYSGIRQLARIPLCKCRLPCQLRSVVRRERNFGRYFYCCQAASSQQGRQCDFFAWWDETADQQS